ncbi:MAG: hypothetical protein DRQ02_04765 [Candidatus Latescibacterota bacterium]|nr:MAG: hypothetical protein DRQ02_04765 [Candidatus Latescibacterota bacterium]
MYQKAFLTAEFAKKSQRTERANYPFTRPSPALRPFPFFTVVLNRQILIQTQDVVFKPTDSNPIWFDTSVDSVGENGVVASTVGSLRIAISVGGLSRARFHRRLEDRAS